MQHVFKISVKMFASCMYTILYICHYYYIYYIINFILKNIYKNIILYILNTYYYMTIYVKCMQYECNMNLKLI